MTPQQARNVVAILQKDPLFYRNFGVWWWHVKGQLKANGFTTDNLSSLGDFTDQSDLVVDSYEGLTTVDLDRKAYEFQWDHTFHKYNVNTSLTPSGEVYMVQDQDVE